MNKAFLYKRFHSVNKDDGFVMITALMVIFLVVSIVATVVAVTSADMTSSARARAVIRTRFVAESVSDNAFGQIARLQRGFYEQLVGYGISGQPANVDNSLFFNSGTNKYGNWFALNGNGELKKCTAISEICFKARIHRVESVVDVAKRDELTLDLVVRGACTSGSLPDDVNNCIYRQFQTRFRTRSYVDTVVFSDTESSDAPGVEDIPNATGTGVEKPRVAFLPGDKDNINGAIQTNDDRGFLYCGNVDLPAATKLRGLVMLPLWVPQCQSANSDTLDPRADQLLPGQVDTRGYNNAETNNSSVFANLAGKNTTGSKYYLKADATIELKAADGAVVINGTEVGYPSNGVIYSEKAIAISGTYNRSLTIFAENGIVISNNLVNAVDPVSSQRLLGLVTPGDIVLACGTSGGSECNDRTVHAVLRAKRVYNDQWASAVVDGTPPTFTLIGAIISNSRPVFGGYTTDSGNKLGFGWQKNLTFDSRLLDDQPPFFFRTTQASVVRSALDEDRCTETFCPGN